MIIDIKNFREKEGIKQEEIAQTLGVSQSYVSQLFNGQKRMSESKWNLLVNKYSNITKYVITYDDENKESNITHNNSKLPSIEEDKEEKIPAYILKMHNEERKRFDEQMNHVLAQNDEMLRQNRILVETLREQNRYLTGDRYKIAETQEGITYSTKNINAFDDLSKE